jgi:hypothetical protein
MRKLWSILTEAVTAADIAYPLFGRGEPPPSSHELGLNVRQTPVEELLGRHSSVRRSRSHSPGAEEPPPPWRPGGSAFGGVRTAALAHRVEVRRRGVARDRCSGPRLRRLSGSDVHHRLAGRALMSRFAILRRPATPADRLPILLHHNSTAIEPSTASGARTPAPGLKLRWVNSRWKPTVMPRPCPPRFVASCGLAVRRVG